MRADRHRGTGVILQALGWAALLGVCSAGNRPFHGWERSRHRRQDQGAQRVHFPSLNGHGGQQVQYPLVHEQGTQQLQYPSVHDRGQTVHHPCVTDNTAGSQIQVKQRVDLKSEVLVD